ncbi:hypothetical protein L612_002200000510 [Rhodococcus rhodochrous J38]|nr:hypothetical protein L612_002200000510 [Rhodococcus rhodochrous J38]
MEGILALIELAKLLGPFVELIGSVSSLSG